VIAGCAGHRRQLAGEIKEGGRPGALVRDEVKRA
jgi:hypothetical protein